MAVCSALLPHLGEWRFAADRLEEVGAPLLLYTKHHHVVLEMIRARRHHIVKLAVEEAEKVAVLRRALLEAEINDCVGTRQRLERRYQHREQIGAVDDVGGDDDVVGRRERGGSGAPAEARSEGERTLDECAPVVLVHSAARVDAVRSHVLPEQREDGLLVGEGDLCAK